jgi:hypothetical protein
VIGPFVYVFSQVSTLDFAYSKIVSSKKTVFETWQNNVNAEISSGKVRNLLLDLKNELLEL